MPELSPDWSSPGYIASAWYLLLLLLGLVSLVYVIVHHQRWRGLPLPGVREWEMGWIDIGILFCMLFMWVVLAGLIGEHLMALGDSPTADQLAWRNAVDGTLLQGGMALIFVAFWLAQPYELRLALSSEPMGRGRAFCKALVFLLALMPIRYVVEVSWMALLNFLQSRGLPITLDTQDVVNELSSTRPLGAFVLLVIMACILAPIVEELVFRAGLYRFLKGRIGKEAGIFVSAALFAMLHFNLLSFPTLMILGIALCLAYEGTGNLKVPIFMHALFNLNSVFLIVLQSWQ